MEASPNETPRVRGWQAIVALAAWIVGQLGCAGVAFLAAMTLAALVRMGPTDAARAVVQVVPAAVLMGTACGGLVLALVLRLCLGPSFAAAGRGLGVVLARPAACAGALVLGLGLGALALAGSAGGRAPSVGPVANVASLTVVGFAVWAVLAVLFLPLVEEFLFRGVLVQGFSGLGLAGAAVASSALFMLVHVADVWGSWTGAALLLLMAAATMGARLASGSLLPPVLFHAAYNLVLVAFLGMALHAGTPNPFMPAWQGSWLYAIVGDEEGTVRELGRELERHPDDADALLRQGIALNKLGRKEEALACYERALPLEPRNPILLNNLGYVLAELGYYEEALERCDTSLRIRPDDAHTSDSRGYALVGLGRYEEAVQEYRRTVDLDPDSAYPWYGLGEALRRLGDEEGAEEAFAIARDLDPALRLTWRPARPRAAPPRSP